MYQCVLFQAKVCLIRNNSQPTAATLQKAELLPKYRSEIKKSFAQRDKVYGETIRQCERFFYKIYIFLIILPFYL